jgi:predicted ABC-type ATPase
MKKYVLLAGVNGAGKSTFFSLVPSLSKIEKINLDDTVREIGDWRNAAVVARAGRLVQKRQN